ACSYCQVLDGLYPEAVGVNQVSAFRKYTILDAVVAVTAAGIVRIGRDHHGLGSDGLAPEVEYRQRLGLAKRVDDGGLPSIFVDSRDLPGDRKLSCSVVVGRQPCYDAVICRSVDATL